MDPHTAASHTAFRDQYHCGFNFVENARLRAPLPMPLDRERTADETTSWQNDHILREVGRLLDERDALEAARLQSKASMARFERLGRACAKYYAFLDRRVTAECLEYGEDLVRRHLFPEILEFMREYKEWLAGEPKPSTEAT